MDTKKLATKLKQLKKDLGATSIRQGYKGTGSQKDRRQMWVSFDWNSRGLDIWISAKGATLGGVISPISPTPTIAYEDKTEDQVYYEILQALSAWKDAR